MKNVRQLSLFVVLAVLCLWQNAAAELLPVFEMESEVMKATAIVEGHFDEKGLFVVNKIIKGAIEPQADLSKANLEEASGRFAVAMGEDKASSYIVFLEKTETEGKAIYVQGFAGMVAISKSDKVYARLESAAWDGSAIQAHATWTQSSFLSELSRARLLSDQLSAILAMPHGDKDRTKALLDFAVANGHAASSTGHYNRYFGSGHGFFFYKSAQGMFKPSTDEEAMLRRRLVDATNNRERELLIAFVGSTQCSQGMFAALLPYVVPGTQDSLRSEAMKALGSVNPFEAAGVLSNYLELDDPQRDDVIRSLSNCGRSREGNVLNQTVLAPLRNLGKATLRSLKEERTHNPNTGYAVIGLIQDFFHPSLLPLLIQWAESKDTGTSSQARSSLRSAIGISQEAVTDEAVETWWQQEKAVLEKEYDLTSATGIGMWLDAWNGTPAPMTKTVLLRLWDFQPSIPEALLLDWCESPRSVASKKILSEFWQRKRLTPETRKEIVRRYVKMKIIMEQSFYSKEPAPGEIQISGNRLFPFPEEASVNTTGDVSGRYEPRIQDPNSLNGVSLFGSGPRAFYTSSGTGDRSVKGILEVWEIDYRATPPKELWRLRWKLSQTFGEKAKEVPALKD